MKTRRVGDEPRTAGLEPPPHRFTMGALEALPTGRDDSALVRVIEPSVSFRDLVLPEETVRLLTDITNEMSRWSLLHSHALRPRNRLLFVGPPGSGKTATAMAMAAELGWRLVRVELPTVVSSLLGETARNIAAIFRFCEKGNWVLVFDELDAVARERADPAEHGELKRVVATFLQLLDEFYAPTLVVAATNHPAVLDSAVWRRFDEVVPFGILQGDQVRKLVELRLGSVRHKIGMSVVLPRMRGFSPAEIEMVCHNAMRHALVEARDTVLQQDMIHALRSMEDRRRTIRGFSR